MSSEGGRSCFDASDFSVSFPTPADGRTFINFAQNPLPAGVLCEGSASFAERIPMKGLPLATDSKKLASIDTVVERLDDATFDAKGTALTRIRLRALSLQSLAPIATPCGSFDVYLTLKGTQRETIMRITREDAYGGSFVAPLAVASLVTFVPAGSTKGEPRSIGMAITFPNHTRESWAHPPTNELRILTPFRIDLDGDGKPETRLSGAGNFLAGARGTENGLEALPGGGTWYCHYSGEAHEHCYYLCDGCAIP